jgi:hypothetical protein
MHIYLVGHLVNENKNDIDYQNNVHNIPTNILEDWRKASQARLKPKNQAFDQ